MISEQKPHTSTRWKHTACKSLVMSSVVARAWATWLLAGQSCQDRVPPPAEVRSGHVKTGNSTWHGLYVNIMSDFNIMFLVAPCQSNLIKLLHFQVGKIQSGTIHDLVYQAGPSITLQKSERGSNSCY